MPLEFLESPEPSTTHTSPEEEMHTYRVTGELSLRVRALVEGGVSAGSGEIFLFPNDRIIVPAKMDSHSPSIVERNGATGVTVHRYAFDQGQIHGLLHRAGVDLDAA